MEEEEEVGSIEVRSGQGFEKKGTAEGLTSPFAFASELLGQAVAS